MAKKPTGAVLVGAATRLELSYLLRGGLILKGFETSTVITWNYTVGGTLVSESSARVECYYTTDHGYLKIFYTTQHGQDHYYTVPLIERRSNLGKGHVLYMLCPITGKPCRILYRAYGSTKFMSREAYEITGRRIYYRCQLSYNAVKWADRKSQAQDNIERMLQQGRTSYRRLHRTYKGKLTKAAQRYLRLETKATVLESRMWAAMEQRLRQIKGERLKITG